MYLENIAHIECVDSNSYCLSIFFAIPEKTLLFGIFRDDTDFTFYGKFFNVRVNRSAVGQPAALSCQFLLDFLIRGNTVIAFYVRTKFSKNPFTYFTMSETY